MNEDIPQSACSRSTEAIKKVFVGFATAKAFFLDYLATGVFIAAFFGSCNARSRAECNGRLSIIGGGSNRVTKVATLDTWDRRFLSLLI